MVYEFQKIAVHLKKMQQFSSLNVSKSKIGAAWLSAGTESGFQGKQEFPSPGVCPPSFQQWVTPQILEPEVGSSPWCEIIFNEVLLGIFPIHISEIQGNSREFCI